LNIRGAFQIIEINVAIEQQEYLILNNYNRNTAKKQQQSK